MSVGATGYRDTIAPTSLLVPPNSAVQGPINLKWYVVPALQCTSKFSGWSTKTQFLMG